ncbi:MAG: hypothetical protein DI535_06220 [Citrobacter freundii]|nr:MAG: hypothetical protein DI535_06220 [Citrobacter freundii]
MLKKITFIAALFISISGAAQKPVYRGNHYLGLLAGEDNGFQVTTVNGIETGGYFFGIGTGFDSYGKAAIPLFVSISKYLSASERNFFLSLNAGTSFAAKKGDLTMLFNARKVSSQPRPFGEAGLGYRFKTKGMKTGQGVLFGAYYSYKGMREKFTLPGNCNNPPCAERYEYLDYKFNRWAFKVGVAL